MVGLITRVYFGISISDVAETKTRLFSFVNFPIINQSMPGNNDDDSALGAVGDALPGFGLMAGMSALAMAAVASSRINKKQ